MSRKGNGYNATDVVSEAMKKCGCLEEDFFSFAARFGNMIGFNPGVEAEKFKKANTPPPPIVTAFANWVLVADQTKVARRLQTFRAMG